MKLIEKQQAVEAIKTVVMARWFFVTVAIAQVVSLQLIYSGTQSVLSLPRLAILAGTCYGYNFLYWLYLRRSPENMGEFGLRAVRVLQVVGDMIVISAMLYFDQTVTIFVAAYFLDDILIASIIYKKQGIFLTTLATCLLFTVLAYAEYLGHFPPIRAPFYYGLKGNFILFERTLILFWAGMIGASFFSGSIAALFRRREKRLEDQMKMVEEARLAQETEKNKVAAVIQNLTDGLIMIDNRDRVTLINREAEKMMSASKSSVVGRVINDLSNENLKKVGQLLTESGGSLNKKVMTLDGDKEVIMEVSTAVVVDIFEQKLGKLIIFHDVTREKVIDRLKSDFVTIAAHQLRTPLSAIKWAFNLVLGGDLGKVDKKQAEVLEKGYQSNERMIVLINDLLNVARIEEGRFVYQPSIVSFSDLIKEAIAELHEKIQAKNIKLEIEDVQEIMVNVDKEKMVLALRNLIENAVNYSPVTSSILIRAKKDDHSLAFSIKDPGIGIPKKQHNRVFGRFFRTDNAMKSETEGSGLGLFIVKNIIESHGGKIWFESEENKGSTFYFTLPLND